MWVKGGLLVLTILDLLLCEVAQLNSTSSVAPHSRHAKGHLVVSDGGDMSQQHGSREYTHGCANMYDHCTTYPRSPRRLIVGGGAGAVDRRDSTMIGSGCRLGKIAGRNRSWVSLPL